MKTILAEFDFGKKLRNYRTLRWRSSTNSHQQAVRTSWEILSPQREHTLLHYLQTKNILGLTSEIEQRALYDHPKGLTDIYTAVLLAQKVGIESDIFEERCRILARLTNTRPFEFSKFKVFEGNVRFQLREITFQIRRPTPYSGYVRNISSLGKGRKRNQKPESETFEWTNSVEIDYYEFLIVGALTTGNARGLYCTLKEAKKQKR